MLVMEVGNERAFNYLFQINSKLELVNYPRWYTGCINKIPIQDNYEVRALFYPQATIKTEARQRSINNWRKTGEF